MKKIITLLPLLGLMACAGNEFYSGNRTFNPTPEQRQQMLADKIEFNAWSVPSVQNAAKI